MASPGTPAPIIRPAGTAGTPGPLASLPADLVEQIRGRVGVIALLMFLAFAFDSVLHAGRSIAATLGYEVVAEPFDHRAALWINVLAMAMSAGLWLAARHPRVRPGVLHALGLAYEIAICFVIALLTNWMHFLEYGILPNLTWVPAVVILFPLLLPGPPARMLAAACLAGAASPLALAVLAAGGVVTAGGEAYFRATVASAFAVVFAFMGARLVYRLGRQVATAREMGSYVLEEKLGEGAMGEVWRARHRLLARPAAIKLIRVEPDAGALTPVADTVRRRFEREAQATAQLRSPHTVELFDFGVAPDGTFYYVMELLDGLTADEIVRRFGPLPAARVIPLLEQVCHSLSEAEARGLVHRDIKPANIFICRYGEDCDFVKVLDFGLVKTFGDASETAPALTRENVVAGTPAFMAPEQAMGTGAVDSRADIYSLGCVAWWLLTGRTLFQADSPVAMVLEHARSRPAPPSSVAGHSIPPALDELVLACLAKAPADRPASAREVARRLAAIDPGRRWTDEDARAWWRLNVV